MLTTRMLIMVLALVSLNQTAQNLPLPMLVWSEAGTVALVDQFSSRFEGSRICRYHGRHLSEDTVVVLRGNITKEIVR